MNPAALPPLSLDYQRPPPGRQLPGMVMLAASLIVAALLFKISLDLAEDVARAEQRVARLRQAAEHRRLFESAAQPAVAVDEPRLPASPSAARWEALFADLETAADPSVTLLGLVPGNREIVITGEASGLAAVLDYVRRLQAARSLNNAYLSRYEVVREHPREPVRFTALAEWKEAAR